MKEKLYKDYIKNIAIESNYVSWLRYVLIVLVLSLTINKLDTENQIKFILVKNLIFLSLILMIYFSYLYVNRVIKLKGVQT